MLQVLGVSFSPNGYHLATGSEDNFCRIWDLRKRKNIYSIPAHKNLISQVKYEPQEGYFLATSSYDTKAAVCLIDLFFSLPVSKRSFYLLMDLKLVSMAFYVKLSGISRTYTFITSAFSFS
jgi:WD40 repeat protein